MAEKTINALTVFDNGAELNYIEKDGEILFTAEEIGRQLGYSNPANAVHKLFNKNQNELKLYTVDAKLASTDGKSYETRVFTEEGVYIISMLARTNQAKKFRARVALLLRRLRQEAARRQLEEAHAAGLELAAQNAREVLALTPADRKRMQKILAYLARGFTCREIAKVMEDNQRRVAHLISRAKRLGLGV